MSGPEFLAAAIGALAIGSLIWAAWRISRNP
jgi:hypothetical protein